MVERIVENEGLYLLAVTVLGIVAFDLGLLIGAVWIRI
jgi:hypothetical protein